jgi:hypothetical protein
MVNLYRLSARIYPRAFTGVSFSLMLFLKSITVLARHRVIGYHIHRAGDRSIGLRMDILSGDNGFGTGNFVLSLTLPFPNPFSDINIPPPVRADVLRKFLLEK